MFHKNSASSVRRLKEIEKKKTDGNHAEENRQKDIEKEREERESKDKEKQSEIQTKVREKIVELEQLKDIIEKLKGKKYSFIEAFTSVKRMLGEFSEKLPLEIDVNSKQKAMKRIEDELTKCLDYFETPELTPTEVIENSTAVQGTFVTKNRHDWIEPRRQMVNIGIDVKFMKPTLTQSEKMVEHNSKSSSNAFEKAVKKSGFGLAEELKASSQIIGGGLNYEGGSQEDDKSKHKKSAFMSYFCKTTYAVVPVALWIASLSDLVLCKDIVEDLKKTEYLIAIDEKALARGKVNQIFQNYGSHFYCGNTHFGGLFQVNTEFQSKEESTKSPVEEIVCKTHSESINSFFGINYYSKGNVEEVNESGEYSKVHTFLTKLGGPTEIKSLGLWKKALVQNNNSWVVVDGGRPAITDDQFSHQSFVGLWNLVQREATLFKDSIVLSNLLLDTWHDISGLKVPVNMLKIDKVHWHKSKICRFIDKSARKELKSDSSVGIFKTLINIVQRSVADIGDHSVWKEELRTNCTLHSLLERLLVVHFIELDAIETSHQVNKLLTMASDVHFSQKVAVLEWLKQIEKPNTKLLRADKINSIESFFVEMSVAASSDKFDFSSLTVEVATAIQKVLKKFRTEKALIEYMVFVNFAISLDFDVKDCKFRVQMNSDRLSLCINKTAKVQEDLMKFKKLQSTDTALQVRLFQNIVHSIVSVTKDCKYSDGQNMELLRTIRFQETRQDILDHFEFLIVQSINTATKINDVNEVVDILEELVDGREHVSRSRLSWIYFEKISGDILRSCGALQDAALLNKIATDTVVTRYTGKTDINMEYILKTFGLKEYFPEKITVQMALTVHENSANSNEKKIPWKILKNIISANSDFREKVLKDFWNTSTEAQSSKTDLLDDLSSSDEDVTSQTEMYHPSDVFLAIFQCSDPFLKRLIATKLFFCQFAVPILFNDSTNQNLVFSAWPINDIVLHGETESLITNARQSVSFIRVGKGAVPSKSKLINEFLRELNEEHATFIHKDCPLGMNRRTISKGMIELSWLVPEQQAPTTRINVPENMSNDNIKAPLNIFNLRGDVHEFDRQLNLLLLLSNVMVVLISYDDLQGEKFTQVLQTVHRSNTSVIILTDMAGGKGNKAFLKHYIKEMKIDKSKTTVLSTLDKQKDLKKDLTNKLSSSYLKEILTNKIVRLLEKNEEGVQIQKIKINLPEGIRSDESQKCVIGRRLAESLLKACMQDESPEHRKDIFLPLQGKHLWHEISIREKDLKRTKPNVFDKEETILRSIRQLHRQQTDTCNKAPHAFSIFVETLLKYSADDEVLQYFIIWFKQRLNNQSRVLMKDLLQNFFAAFKNYESTKDNKEEGSMSKVELDQAEKMLAEASFGTEHFFREVGQVYEAFEHTSDDSQCQVTYTTRIVLKTLPFVVAKLLLLGHPFEIMDGDAANVPQKWVTAVLKEVQNIVGAGKKIMTVSVLGIQSSGKSTLLNTMFGLEFSVSAGRCTRGIYMQVVPVSSLENIEADYMLVLDTEGLRAPERAGEKVHHDNEIATLVVGLADFVLLNLKGESISDMSNILEIVITGLLRLKQVNKNLTLRQSCMFIHQNVSKDAQLLLLQGNRTIVKHLDTMTKDVAIQEKINDIEHFADVIKFDPTVDIKYVPELFHGSPGMGPVNQKYSLEVTDVQDCIFREKTSVIQPVTFKNYLLHLQSLWQGIQAEDFIFSFRSILEIKSYSILESEYQKLIWELEELKLAWMNNNIKPRLQCCQNVSNIDQCARKMITECREIIDAKYEESDKSLQQFVKTSELQEHMEHYIAEKCFNMKAKRTQLEHDTVQSINQETLNCTSKLSREDILTLKEKQITNAARELARDFSGKTPTKQEMEYGFQKLWTQFLNELASEIPQNKQAEKNEIMKFDIETKLNELYENHSQLLRKGLKEHPIDKGSYSNCLKNDLQNIQIDSDHICISFSTKLKKLFAGKCFNAQALNLIRKIFVDIDQDFVNFHLREAEYNKSQFSAIMKRIVTSFKSCNESSSNNCVTFTPKLELQLLYVLHAIPFFNFKGWTETMKVIMDYKLV